MSAQDYPVYFKYGAITAPYTPASPHRGNDRCNKLGVPVVVEGTQIGLTGFSGKVLPKNELGAHLHTQEWQGTPANTRKPQNEFKGGKVVAATSSSDFGNYVTIQTDDGWNDTYAHLSRIDVKVGQKIGAKVMPEDGVRFGILGVTGQQPMDNYEQEVKYWTGRDVLEYCRYLNGLGDYYMVPARKRIKELEEEANSDYIETKVYVRKDKK